jgi:hypothetical protein
MPRRTSFQKTLRYRGLRDGLPTLWEAFGGVSPAARGWTLQGLTSALQALLDAEKECDVAYAAYQAKVKARRDLEKKSSALLADLTELAHVYFFKQPAKLAKLGLKERKKGGARTTQAKAAAARKGHATKVTRGTTGKGRRRR